MGNILPASKMLVPDRKCGPQMSKFSLTSCRVGYVSLSNENTKKLLPAHSLPIDFFGPWDVLGSRGEDFQ